MSPSTHFPFGKSFRAVAIIAAELSNPVSSAPGHRCASTAVLLPGPHPKSITRPGFSSLTRAAKSTAGCVRSAANFKYCSLFHVGMKPPSKAFPFRFSNAD
jgi:hypothetical protein